MTKRTTAGIAFVVIVASVTLAPHSALAQRRHDGRGEGSRLRTVVPHLPTPHFIAPPRFVGRPFFPRPFVRGVVVVPPVVGYAPGYAALPSYYDTSMYAPPPAYAPPPVYAPPPAYGPPIGAPGGSVSIAPPMPDVIEYANGRYELRGDGINTPYKWVWIPNPPPGPPADAAPPPGPVRHTTLYRWTDKDGAVHWTDRLDAVPEAYRSKVTKSQS